MPGARDEPENGNWVELERLCPSCWHVQPPNCTPPALSPHYPETLRSRDPIYQPLLPIHLLSQMHYGRLREQQSIHHLWGVRSPGFIPKGRSTTLFPAGGTAAPYVADDYNSVAGWQQQALLWLRCICACICLCSIKYVIKLSRVCLALTVNLNTVSATTPHQSAVSTPER